MSTRGDLNGDQIDDFVIYTNDEDYLGWIEIDHNTVQYHDDPESAALRVNSIRTADFDGDSDLDMLVTSRGDAEVAWYENLDGTYVFAEGIERGPTLDSIPFDVDGDGDMDVISHDWSQISWYENTSGEDRFANRRIFQINGWRINGIVSANVDQDEANELVISDSNGVRVLEVTDRELKLSSIYRPGTYRDSTSATQTTMAIWTSLFRTIE